MNRAEVPRLGRFGERKVDIQKINKVKTLGDPPENGTNKEASSAVPEDNYRRKEVTYETSFKGKGLCPYGVAEKEKSHPHSGYF